MIASFRSSRKREHPVLSFESSGTNMSGISLLLSANPDSSSDRNNISSLLLYQYSQKDNLCLRFIFRPENNSIQFSFQQSILPRKIQSQHLPVLRSFSVFFTGKLWPDIQQKISRENSVQMHQSGNIPFDERKMFIHVQQSASVHMKEIKILPFIASYTAVGKMPYMQIWKTYNFISEFPYSKLQINIFII